MALKFYMDVHVQSAITNGLQQRGLDVLTAQEDGYRQASDSELLSRATELRRIMFTRDEDFLAEAHKRQQEGVLFSGVVYTHQIGISLGQCVKDLEIIAQVNSYEEMANTVTYLPL